MKSRLLSILFILSCAVLSADSVNWLDDYNKALEEGERQKKNLFVLITAPDWCVWCQRLEENVLSKPDFQNYLSENYIPLKILDKVDGVRNPQLRFFDVAGFPSVFIYDYGGGFIENIYTQDPAAMIAGMVRLKGAEGVVRPLLKDLQLPDKYTFSSDGGGVYVNQGNGTWQYTSGSEEIEYKQTKYDFNYLYLEHPLQKHVIALPMNGSDRHIAELVEGNWVWSDLSDVNRIGGDPYFD